MHTSTSPPGQIATSWKRLLIISVTNAFEPLDQAAHQEGWQGLLRECHQGLAEPGRSRQHSSQLDPLHPQPGCSRSAPQLFLPLDFLLFLLQHSLPRPGCLYRLYTQVGQIEFPHPPHRFPHNHPDSPHPPLLPPQLLLVLRPPPRSHLPLHCPRSFPESHLWLGGSRQEEL